MRPAACFFCLLARNQSRTCRCVFDTISSAPCREEHPARRRRPTRSRRRARARARAREDLVRSVMSASGAMRAAHSSLKRMRHSTSSSSSAAITRSESICLRVRRSSSWASRRRSSSTASSCASRVRTSPSFAVAAASDVRTQYFCLRRSTSASCEECVGLILCISGSFRSKAPSSDIASLPLAAICWSCRIASPAPSFVFSPRPTWFRRLISRAAGRPDGGFGTTSRPSVARGGSASGDTSMAKASLLPVRRGGGSITFIIFTKFV